MPSIQDILDLGRVMPVIVIDDSSKAVGLANALLEGGIRTIEITLRTNAALDAIRAVANECPDITIGAGTVTSPALAAAAAEAGASFCGFTRHNRERNQGLPGCSSATAWRSHRFSEILSLQEAGFNAVKFFPASAAGGPNFIKSLISPMPSIRVCNWRHYARQRSLTGWRWLMCPALAAAGLHHKPPFLREILTPSQVTPELLQHSRATTVLTDRVIPPQDITTGEGSQSFPVSPNVIRWKYNDHDPLS